MGLGQDVSRENTSGMKYRLEVLLVTAPPPSDAEPEPVRAGIQRGEFDPTGVTNSGDGDWSTYDEDPFTDRPTTASL